VAIDVCGNKEVIANWVNGFLFELKSSKAMVKELLRVLKDNELWLIIGETGRKTIEKSHTCNRITDNILECYENVLHK
jgi:glycosyltransferase involved in cell wall biosynthesis